VAGSQQEALVYGSKCGSRSRKNPTGCSGPPHLLSPWGSAGLGAMRVASSWHRSRPATSFQASNT